MAEKCRCGKSAHGSAHWTGTARALGRFVFCGECFSEISGVPATDLKKPIAIELRDGDKYLGRYTWRPWSFQAGVRSTRREP